MINKVMNYTNHYSILIERARTRKLSGYVERHHVVPRCLGGSDEPDNIVELLPEEHYVAHQLLVKMYPENDLLLYAANMMSKSSTFTQRNNKRYGWIKRRHQEICKKRTGENNPSFGKKWYHCPATLVSGKFLDHCVPDGWVKGRIIDKEKYIETKEKKKDRKLKQQQKVDFARILFEDFVNGGFRSLQEFIDAGNYDKSNESLRMMWKKHIPEYSNTSSQGKPFKLCG